MRSIVYSLFVAIGTRAAGRFFVIYRQRICVRFVEGVLYSVYVWALQAIPKGSLCTFFGAFPKLEVSLFRS